MTNWLKGAEQIGNQICRESIWYEDKCNWISCKLEPFKDQTRVIYSSLNGSLYSGTSGIAFFLAALFSKTGNTIYKNHALAAVRQAISQALKPSKDITGFYLGTPGIAYACYKIGIWTKEEWLIDEAIKLLKSVEKNIPETNQTDLVNGIAGTLLTLVEFEKRSIGGSWLEMIHPLAGRLEKAAVPSPSGLSWATVDNSVHHLCGFAHGASGIGSVFINLFELTGNHHYLEIAQKAFEYEDQYFDEKEQNWPDFRASNSTIENQPPMYMCAWCHGAPGIGLSRTRAYQVTKGEWAKRMALKSAGTTLRLNEPDESGNFSLCHGLCGNADFLHIAGLTFNSQELIDHAVTIGNYCIEQFLQEGIPLPNGAFRDWFNPDLMVGLSGMGYYLLRLENPSKFESILLIGDQAPIPST